MRSYRDLQTIDETAVRHGTYPRAVEDGTAQPAVSLLRGPDPTEGIHSQVGTVTSPCHLTVRKNCGPASEITRWNYNDSVQALIPRDSQRVTASSGHNNTGAVTYRNAALPSVSDLICLALSETDFIGDLDPATLEANCANSIDLAADIWSDAHGYVPVPLSLIQWARCALLLEAEAMLRDRAAHAEAERLDAYEAGDLDRDGNFIPWERYP